MAWTYGNPATSPKDEVRFLIGDTVPTEQLLSDEEITYLLGQHGGAALPAAVDAAFAGAARISRESDRTSGDVAIRHRGRAAEYRKVGQALQARLAAQLEEEAAAGATAADIGYVSQGDPYFSLGMHGEAGFLHTHPDSEPATMPQPR